MIVEFLDMFKDIVNMTDEEKKNRLVEIRRNQLVREELTNDDSITPTEELEAIAILESLVPIQSEESAEKTMEKIMALREEINRKALEVKNKSGNV